MKKLIFFLCEFLQQRRQLPVSLTFSPDNENTFELLDANLILDDYI